MDTNEYLINEKPFKALVLFALPMILGNIFQQFYTMVDSIVVGRFVSEDALAAVGASYSLTNVFICIAIGGGIGASVITSRYFGGREYKKMKTSVYTALFSFLGLSIILGVFGLIFSKPIMELLNTPERILSMSITYLNIYFMGMPFLFMYNIMSAMFNAIGKSRIPLYLLIFSSIINIVLDLYFVLVLNMGVAGVAWATLIAQGTSAVISFLLFLRQISSYESEDAKVFNYLELVKMTKVALPSILQQSTVSIGMMLVQSVINSFGAEALAGFSIAMRAESLFIVPMVAMGNAISSYTAQNIGADQYERVEEGYLTSNKIIVFFGIVIFIIIELFHENILKMFLGDTATKIALDTGIGYLRFMGLFFSILGIKMVTDGVLRGAGDMKIFTIANLVNLSIRVIVAVTMAPKLGIEMVWYAVPIGWFANFVLSYGQYRTGEWKQIPNIN